MITGNCGQTLFATDNLCASALFRLDLCGRYFGQRARSRAAERVIVRGWGASEIRNRDLWPNNNQSSPFASQGMMFCIDLLALASSEAGQHQGFNPVAMETPVAMCFSNRSFCLLRIACAAADR